MLRYKHAQDADAQAATYAQATDVPKHLQGLHITALGFLAGLLAVKTCSGVVEAAGGRIVLHMRLDAITACYALTEKSEKE